MREFKVGDRVAILGTIIDIHHENDIYPITIKIDNSNDVLSTTKEGKFSINDTQQNVRHLEDLQYMYGKEMYVSSVEKSFKVKAYVIGKSNTGLYLYINIDDFEKYKHGVVVDLHQCKYVAELTAIPPRNLIRERDELLNKLADIIIEIQQSKI